MRIIALEEFLRVLEDDLGEGDLTHKKIRALAEELAEDERRVISLEELQNLLDRRSPIGSYESDVLEVLRKASIVRPSDQDVRLGNELPRTESWEPSPEKVLDLLESGSPVGQDESAFLDAVRRLGYQH